MTGLLAVTFALKADSVPGPVRPAQPLLGGVDVLPKSGSKPTSMVVLLHGFGGNGESMRWVADAWAKQLPNTVFVMPDAPDQCHENPNDPQSREWFATRALDPDDAARVAQIRAVEPRLNAYIDAKLAQYGLHDRCLAISGISQGAMMVLHAAPRRRQPCAAVAAFCGMVVDRLGLRRDHLVRMPVMLAHGDQDTVVPFAKFAEAQGDLRTAGFHVDAVSYHAGHSVTPAVLRQGGAFIANKISTSCTRSIKRRFTA